MSLHPHVIEPVPEETARVARAAFPKGHPYLTFRDALGTVFQDEDFTALFPMWGQPGLPPWRLALVTIMQFRENLADRQAAEAVRARIDWKYLLGLELTDPGFDFSVLSEFRDRLLGSNALTPRMCWPPSGCSTAWNSSPRHCVPPSTHSPRWHLTGSKDWHPWHGMNGTADGSRIRGCPGSRP